MDKSNFQHLNVVLNQRIAVVTIHRPEKRNALSPEVLTEITTAFKSLPLDPEINVIILTGGEQYFSAGFDLNEIRKLEKVNNEDYIALFHETYRSILFCPLPVICAVGGAAIAGGFDLTMMCDFRYASDKAKFGQREIALSLTPILDPLWRIVGLGIAKELTLTGRIYDASEAKLIGYVNEIYPDGQLLQNVLEIASNMSQFDRQCLIETKQLSHQTLNQDLGSSMQTQEWLFRTYIGSKENHQRIDSLLEKMKKNKS